MCSLQYRASVIGAELRILVLSNLIRIQEKNRLGSEPQENRSQIHSDKKNCFLDFVKQFVKASESTIFCRNPATAMFW